MLSRMQLIHYLKYIQNSEKREAQLETDRFWSLAHPKAHQYLYKYSKYGIAEGAQ